MATGCRDRFQGINYPPYWTRKNATRMDIFLSGWVPSAFRNVLRHSVSVLVCGIDHWNYSWFHQKYVQGSRATAETEVSLNTHEFSSFLCFTHESQMGCFWNNYSTQRRVLHSGIQPLASDCGPASWGDWMSYKHGGATADHFRDEHRQRKWRKCAEYSDRASAMWVT